MNRRLLLASQSTLRGRGMSGAARPSGRAPQDPTCTDLLTAAPTRATDPLRGGAANRPRRQIITCRVPPAPCSPRHPLVLTASRDGFAKAVPAGGVCQILLPLGVVPHDTFARSSGWLRAHLAESAPARRSKTPPRAMARPYAVVTLTGAYVAARVVSPITRPPVAGWEARPPCCGDRRRGAAFAGLAGSCFHAGFASGKNFLQRLLRRRAI
jgi:hypothetical protein